MALRTFQNSPSPGSFYNVAWQKREKVLISFFITKTLVISKTLQTESDF